MSSGSANFGTLDLAGLLLLSQLGILLTRNTLCLLLASRVLLIHLGAPSHAAGLDLLTDRWLLLELLDHAAADVLIDVMNAFWYQL